MLIVYITNISLKGYAHLILTYKCKNSKLSKQTE